MLWSFVLQNVKCIIISSVIQITLPNGYNRVGAGGSCQRAWLGMGTNISPHAAVQHTQTHTYAYLYTDRHAWFKAVMGDSPEKKTIRVDSVSNSIQLSHHYSAWHDATVQVYKVLTVQPHYKTLINHESWCLNSRQEAVWEQWDGAKWEGVWNRNGKCGYWPVI